MNHSTFGDFRNEHIVREVAQWLSPHNIISMGCANRQFFWSIIVPQWREVPHGMRLSALFPPTALTRYARLSYDRFTTYNSTIRMMALGEADRPPYSHNSPLPYGSSLRLAQNDLPAVLHAIRGFIDSPTIFPNLEDLELVLVQHETMVGITGLLREGRLGPLRALKLWLACDPLTFNASVDITGILSGVESLSGTLEKCFLHLPNAPTDAATSKDVQLVTTALVTTLRALTRLTEVELHIDCFHIPPVISTLAQLPVLQKVIICPAYRPNWEAPMPLPDASFKSLTDLTFCEGHFSQAREVLLFACTHTLSRFQTSFATWQSVTQTFSLLSVRFSDTLTSIEVSWPPPDDLTIGSDPNVVFRELSALRLCRELRVLQIVLWQNAPIFLSDQHLIEMASWWPNIEYLEISEGPDFCCPATRPDGSAWLPAATPAALVAFSRSCLRLTELHISIDLRSAETLNATGVSDWEPFAFPRLRQITFGHAQFDSRRKATKFLARVCPAFGPTNKVRHARAKLMLKGFDEEARNYWF